MTYGNQGAFHLYAPILATSLFLVPITVGLLFTSRKPMPNYLITRVWPLKLHLVAMTGELPAGVTVVVVEWGVVFLEATGGEGAGDPLLRGHGRGTGTAAPCCT